MSPRFRLGWTAWLLPVALIAASPAPSSSPEARVDAAVKMVGFAGAVLMAKGDRIQVRKTYGRPVPKAVLDFYEDTSNSSRLPDAFDLRNNWRWASVTKQVIAVLVMQEVETGRIDLDSPISRYLPAFQSANRDQATVRQLLKHQAGLPNPDDSPVDAKQLPAFYARGFGGDRDPVAGYCAGLPKAAPGGNWEYNNCDYMVAGAMLEAVTGKPWAALVEERIARPLKLRSLKPYPRTGNVYRQFETGDDGRIRSERPFDLTAFGASGALHGTIDDLWHFDRALMTGRLIGAKALAELWQSSPEQGFIALGQWVYEVPIRGCAAPVRIVERRGSIGGTAVRNFILPDKDMVVIAFTNRGAFDAGFGEPWQGQGFSHDLISAAACA